MPTHAQTPCLEQELQKHRRPVVDAAKRRGAVDPRLLPTRLPCCSRSRSQDTFAIVCSHFQLLWTGTMWHMAHGRPFTPADRQLIVSPSGQPIASPSPAHRQLIGSSWPAHGQLIASSSPAHRQLITSSAPTERQLSASSSRAFHETKASTSLAHPQPIASSSPAPRELIASLSPAYRQRITSSPPAHRQLIASSWACLWLALIALWPSDGANSRHRSHDSALAVGDDVRVTHPECT